MGFKENGTYRNKVIRREESRFWEKSTFLRVLPSIENFAPNAVVTGPLVCSNNWVNQHSNENFVEFSDLQWQEIFGYDADEMRNNGCGISSLHVVLSTLAPGYDNHSLTVGQLAAYALAFHRNDLRDHEGNIVSKGNPVLSRSLDWYHDALVFVASTFNIRGYRSENTNLETMCSEFNSLIEDGNNAMMIASVAINYQRPEYDGTGGHLIAINGFKTDNLGKVSMVCVTDSSLSGGKDKRENNWVEVNKHMRNSFKGRAIYLYHKK